MSVLSLKRTVLHKFSSLGLVFVLNRHAAGLFSDRGGDTGVPIEDRHLHAGQRTYVVHEFVSGKAVADGHGADDRAVLLDGLCGAHAEFCASICLSTMRWNRVMLSLASASKPLLTKWLATRNMPRPVAATAGRARMLRCARGCLAFRPGRPWPWLGAGAKWRSPRARQAAAGCRPKPKPQGS
jgi:hypothetical protein